MSYAVACAEMRITSKTLWNWRRADTIPQGKAFMLLVGYFAIPPDVFRAAAEGVSELAPKYRSRTDWLIRRAQVQEPATTPRPQEPPQLHEEPPSPPAPSSSGGREQVARTQRGPFSPEEVTRRESEGLQHIPRQQTTAKQKHPTPRKRKVNS